MVALILLENRWGSVLEDVTVVLMEGGREI